MYEIAIMNPRGKRRKARKNPKRKRASSMARKRNSKGRFVKARSNPRRKRARRRNPVAKVHKRRRKHRAVVAHSNPRRKRRRSNPRHHYRARRRRSNPSLAGITSSIVPMLKEGAIGGAGGLINSVLLGYALPMLPATFTTGYALDGMRILFATALAVAGKKFGGHYGETAGKGAIAVAMYHLFKDITVNMAPTLPLGDYEEIQIFDTSQIAGYVDPATTMGAYMGGPRGRFLPDGSRAAPGMGAYMGAYMGGTEAYRGSDPNDRQEEGDPMAGTDY